MNTAEDNRKQKSLSKMIQDFENLFHQELINIKKANKMFAV